MNFLNLLDEPTTIHWHGIRNLNDMDGVPGLTQPAVEPGKSHRYRFPLKDSGLFWYHAHSQAWTQVAKGLYGPLLVRDVNDETHQVQSLKKEERAYKLLEHLNTDPSVFYQTKIRNKA